MALREVAWHPRIGRNSQENSIRPNWGSGLRSHHLPREYSPEELAVVQLVARGHSAGAKHNDLPPILVIS